MKTFKTLSVVTLASLALVLGSAMTARAQDDEGEIRTFALTTPDEEYEADVVEVIGPESRPAPRLGFSGRIVGTGLRVESVNYGSLAFEAGLERGDVIREINGRPIRSMAGYRRALLDAVDFHDGRVRLVVENVRWHTGESSVRYVTRTLHLPVVCHLGNDGFDG